MSSHFQKAQVTTGLTLVNHGKEEVWRPSSTIPKGRGTENCFPAGEAKRWSLQNAMQKGNFPNGFDGNASSKASEDHIGSIAKSDSDLSSAQQRDGDGNYDSFVKVTVSNGVGSRSGDSDVETNKFRLASMELQDSTIGFRAALMESERRSSDDLSELTQGLDESGDEGRDEDEEQKNKEKNGEALGSS